MSSLLGKMELIILTCMIHFQQDICCIHLMTNGFLLETFVRALRKELLDFPPWVNIIQSFSFSNERVTWLANSSAESWQRGRRKKKKKKSVCCAAKWLGEVINRPQTAAAAANIVTIKYNQKQVHHEHKLNNTSSALLNTTTHSSKELINHFKMHLFSNP